MAFPDDLSQVATNLPEEEFNDVVAALNITKNPEISWNPDVFLFIGMCQADFIYKNKEYTITEEYELVISVRTKLL